MSFDPLFPIQSRIQQVSRELADADFDPLPDDHSDDHEAHAEGQTCARCEHTIRADEAVRRRATGDWVHEECPNPPTS